MAWLTLAYLLCCCDEKCAQDLFKPDYSAYLPCLCYRDGTPIAFASPVRTNYFPGEFK